MSDVDLPARLERYGGYAEVRRIALVEKDLVGLPSFKAKPSDPRYKWYRSRSGEDAWELDALDPDTFRERIEMAILEYIDAEEWARMQLVEAAELRTLERFAQKLAESSAG